MPIDVRPGSPYYGGGVCQCYGYYQGYGGYSPSCCYSPPRYYYPPPPPPPPPPPVYNTWGLESQLNSLNSRYNSLNSNKSSMQAQINQKTSQISALELEIVSLKQQIVQKSAEIAALKAKAAQDTARIAQLTSEVNALQAQLDGRIKVVSGLIGEVNALGDQLKALESQITNLESQVATLKSKLATANQTIQDQAASIDNLTQRIVVLKQEKEALQNEVSQKDGTIAGLRSQVASYDAQIAQKQAQIASLTGQLQTQTGINESLRATIQGLEEEIKALLAKKASLEKRISDLLAEIEALRKRISDLEAELTRAGGLIVVQGERIETLLQTLDQRNGIISSLQAQKLELQTYIAKLSEQLKDATTDRSELETALAQAISKIQELGKNLKAYEENAAALVIQLTAAQKETANNLVIIETLQKQQKQLWGLYDLKVAELNAAKQTILNLQDANAKQVEAFRKLEAGLIADIQDVRKKYADAGTIVKQLQASIEQKRQEVQTLRTTCPVIPDGSYIVNGTTGQIYVSERVWESGAWKQVLYPVPPAVYEQRGSPQYTVYTPEKLSNCVIGDPLQLETTTPAPTTIPATTPPPAAHPKFDGTLYIFAHAETWDATGTLRVMTNRLGSLTNEPFVFKDLTQVWLVNPTGYIRNLAGDGEYLINTENCLAPSLGKEVPKEGWRILKKSELEHTVTSPCNTSLYATKNTRTISLEPAGGKVGSGATWYIVPVGQASV